MEARIQSSPAVAIMKVGRHLEKICRVLDRLGLIENAQYIEHATMSGQRVLKLRDVTTNGAPYFSMILVRHGETDTGV